MIPTFSEDHLDILRETSNLAMGKVGADLAKALETFVELSIPEIRLSEPDTILETLAELTSDMGESISVVRQGFDDLLTGEALMVFNEEALRTVNDLLDDDDEGFDATKEREILLDISSIICGACLNSLAENLMGEVNISRPSVFCQRTPASDVFGSIFSGENLNWTQTLLIKISFNLEKKDFKSELLIFLSEQSLGRLYDTLDELLKQY